MINDILYWLCRITPEQREFSTRWEFFGRYSDDCREFAGDWDGVVELVVIAVIAYIAWKRRAVLWAWFIRLAKRGRELAREIENETRPDDKQ